MEGKSETRVLIAAGLFPPDIGGPATYAAMVAKRLPEHGMAVTVLPYGEVRSVRKVFRHLMYTWRLWQQSKGTDVVYALDAMSVGWPALIVSRLRRIPLVVRLGGDYAWEQGSQRFGVTDTLDEFTKQGPKAYGWRVRLFAWLQRSVVKRAARVIVPSKYLRSIVIQWPGVNPNRIEVVYSALFPLPIESSRDELRKQLEFSSFTLLSAGRLVPWKGMAALIDMLVLVQKQIPDATLIIAGEGPEEITITEAAKAAGVSKSVRLVGGLSKGALGAAIKASDVFVYNTAYEGLSHQLLEVMDLGVPVVTTTVGGNPEIVSDNVSGRLVAHNDMEAMAAAVLRIAASEDTRTRLVQNARVRVKDFTADKSAATIADILKSV